MRVRLEAVCTTPLDCEIAEANGADMIELCTALEVGGLTPSFGLLDACRSVTSLPISVMLRTRPGAFGYDEGERRAMERDAQVLRSAGATGFVVGGLVPGGGIDWELLKRIRPLAHGDLVFHRCVDQVEDYAGALRELQEFGVQRVLTSGGAPKAMDGLEALASAVRNHEPAMTILVGGGVRASNVAEIIQKTGATAVHMAPLAERIDPTRDGSRGTDYGALQMLDGAGIAAARAALDSVA